MTMFHDECKHDEMFWQDRVWVFRLDDDKRRCEKRISLYSDRPLRCPFKVAYSVGVGDDMAHDLACDKHLADAIASTFAERKAESDKP